MRDYNKCNGGNKRKEVVGHFVVVRKNLSISFIQGFCLVFLNFMKIQLFLPEHYQFDYSFLKICFSRINGHESVTEKLTKRYNR